MNARRRHLAGASLAIGATILGMAAAACGPAPAAIWSAAPPTPAPSGLARFAEDGLVFDYPAAWREFHYQDVSSMSSVIAFLGTVDVEDPCVRTVDSVSCGAGYVLLPGTLVVTVENAAFPGFNILDVPAGARPLVAGGLPAYVEDTDAWVQAGATAARTWSLARPGSIDNYFRITVQARDPGADADLGQVEALVASLAYDPPVARLPAGQAAATAAATSALAALARNDAAWACFPPSGSRRFQVASLPMGPVLAKPQVATCSTTIEATPLQLWRLHLVLRLAEADPQNGWGSDITVYVGADGQAGSTTAATLER